MARCGTCAGEVTNPGKTGGDDIGGATVGMAARCICVLRSRILLAAAVTVAMALLGGGRHRHRRFRHRPEREHGQRLGIRGLLRRAQPDPRPDRPVPPSKSTRSTRMTGPVTIQHVCSCGIPSRRSRKQSGGRSRPVASVLTTTTPVTDSRYRAIRSFTGQGLIIGRCGSSHVLPSRSMAIMGSFVWFASMRVPKVRSSTGRSFAQDRGCALA